MYKDKKKKSLWRFSILANSYFQASINLRQLLYGAKITPDNSTFTTMHVDVYHAAGSSRTGIVGRYF